MEATPRGALLVFLGAGFGAVARYLLNVGALHWVGPGFPWATLGINFTGSLLIGMISPCIAAESGVRLLVVVGVLGGFTTYSAYALEVFQLMKQGQWQLASAYFLATQVLAIGGCAVGWMLTRNWHASG